MRAERRVTADAADVQRLQVQPAQADARHDAHHILCRPPDPVAPGRQVQLLWFALHSTASELAGPSEFFGPRVLPSPS